MQNTFSPQTFVSLTVARPNQAAAAALRKFFLMIGSGAALSLALANPVIAQDNDVDAYDGTTNVNCGVQTPIGATPTEATPGPIGPPDITRQRNGNDVSGSGHCIDNGSDRNNVSGLNNTLGANNIDNIVSGEDNWLQDGAERNAVSGFGNRLDSGSFSNLVSGGNNYLGTNSSGNIVGGGSNTLGNDNDGNLVTGGSNVLGVASLGNAVSGGENSLGDDTLGNAVSGLRNALGNETAYNTVSGERNTIGPSSESNAVSGVYNVLGEYNGLNTVSGAYNSLGDVIGGSTVNGAYNTLAGGTVPVGGDPEVEDAQLAVSILGWNNTVNAQGPAGSYISILGSRNTVNDAVSSWNTITGHNATVEGTGNFVGGGSETSATAVTGANNVVIGGNAQASGDNTVVLGEGASATADNAVAIGSGSAASLDAAAAAAAYNGVTVSGVVYTEGTDATGEANLGNRLVTGVADGRIASSSSDAVNGHQLFELSNQVTTTGGAVITNTTNITTNTSAIATNTTNITNNAGDIATNTTNIATNTADISTLNTTVNTFSSDINTAVTNSSMALTQANMALSLVTEFDERIDVNSAAIFANEERIAKVSAGVAMALAMPDAYLGSDENLALAGGLSTFSGDVGYAMNMTVRGSNRLSFSAGVAGSQSEYGAKVQARWGK